MEGLEPITYERALTKAWEGLEGGDPSRLASIAGCGFSGGKIEVPFLGEVYIVDLDRRTIRAGVRDPPSFLGVLVLHYLEGCTGERPTGRYLTFREIPGGEMYYPAFKARAIDRLAREFGTRPAALIAAGEAIGGRELDLGDASVEVRPFPLMALVLVVWEGDDEVLASANILFDSLAGQILPMEDLSVVGNLVISKLVKGLDRVDDAKPEVTGRG